jgi:hypothetical protein
VEDWEFVDENTIRLNPCVYKGIAIYGYPGKKSGLEIPELRKIKLNDAPGMFKIFMFHTTLDKAKGTLPIDSIESNLLPKADYYALGPLHIDFQYENFVYPGPIFPNNFQELEDLKFGSFYIVNTDSTNLLKKIELNLKSVETFDITLNNTLTATEKILSEISKRNIEDKIVLLRIHGVLENGKQSDIKFNQIEEIVKQKKAYFMLKNTHDLKEKEVEIEIEVKDTGNIEEEVIKIYSKENPSEFDSLIPHLINALSIEKQEDEKSIIFENRLMDNAKKILGIEKC